MTSCRQGCRQGSRQLDACLPHTSPHLTTEVMCYEQLDKLMQRAAFHRYLRFYWAFQNRLAASGHLHLFLYVCGEREIMTTLKKEV